MKIRHAQATLFGMLVKAGIDVHNEAVVTEAADVLLARALKTDSDEEDVADMLMAVILICVAKKMDAQSLIAEKLYAVGAHHRTSLYDEV